MLYQGQSISSTGHLLIGGMDTIQLAQQYGTPLYLLDEDQIRQNCRRIFAGMKTAFGGNAMPLYAGKALCFKGIYPIIEQEGFGADVVSPGELYTALKAGFPAGKLYYHGSAKSVEDIRFGIENSVGTFVVDNEEELDRISAAAESSGIRQKILIRVTPGIEPHTFEAVRTGQVDSKFGAVIENGQADHLVQAALNLPGIELRGFHCHIGSQIFDAKPYLDAAEIMLRFVAEIKKRYGYQTQELDLGGGFGVRYTEKDPVIDISSMLEKLGAFVCRYCLEHGIPCPKILLEPGRSIVAEAGTTLYTIENIKTIPGYRTYVSVNGGMTDNPRFALYRAKYRACLAAKADQPQTRTVTIAGRCCESGDLLGKDIKLAEPKTGDVLAVFTTGAYNYSMASNYNRVCRPPIVLIRGGNAHLAVRRETYEDLLNCDLY
jgi:diaminopimelate decarboxylase